MERGVIRIVIVLVVAALGFGFKFLRRDNSGADFRKAAHRMVSRVEGYTAKPDYYDWLVDEGHDHCFNNAYHMDYSRRRDDSWVDDGQYIEDLFRWMINQANEDHATQVAAALTKYHDEMAGGGPKKK